MINEESIPSPSHITSEDNSFELFPPKPQPDNNRGNVWVRSISSLLIYLAIGYFFFNSQWIFLLIITGIIVVHELGHFLAMKIFNYKELGIFFIPLLGAYASGTKHEISQTQSVIILLAGPLPGIIAGALIYFLDGQHFFASLSIENHGLLLTTAKLMIFLNLLNLLPIYPLDGGQLLNRLFLDDNNFIAKAFVFLSAAAIAWFAIRISAYVLLIFPLYLFSKMLTENRYDKLTKQIEDSGFDVERPYEAITDEEYWKLRNILIENGVVKNVPPAPPYEYAGNEDKVINAIQNILQRLVIQDMNWAGKLFVLAIWIAAFAIPFIWSVGLPFFRF